MSNEELKARLIDLVPVVLEDCRADISARFQAHGLALSTQLETTVATDTEGGTQFQKQAIEVSGANDVHALIAIWPEAEMPPEGDPTRNYRTGFLAPILQPLAALLAEESEFPKRPHVLGGGATAEVKILTNYLLSLVDQYVRALPSLAEGNTDLAAHLAEQLASAATSTEVQCVWQLAIGGVLVNQQVEYRDVVVRSLQPSERGALLANNGHQLYRSVGLGDFEVPHQLDFFVPDSLLKVTTSRPQTEIQDHSTLLMRVVLSLLLSGVDLSSTGQIMSADTPRFLSFGTLGSPIPVDRRHIDQRVELDADLFRAAVDRAYDMPDLKMSEGTRKDLVFQRLIKGCGAKSGGFLDFAICLESLLLGGVKDELRFRFRLYGALFLSEERDSQTSFDDLKTIYDVRSDLVHGTPVTAVKLRDAEKLAREYAIAVVRRAVDEGWPDAATLDKKAIAFKPGDADETADASN